MSLADLTDAEKVAFLLDELESAADTLRNYSAGTRYSTIVREMRGDQQEEGHEAAE